MILPTNTLTIVNGPATILGNSVCWGNPVVRGNDEGLLGDKE